MEPTGIAATVEALRAGRAFADLSSWRKVLVSGDDARSWLNDLLSARLGDLSLGQARRSLLLSPTGRIRADVTVALLAEGFLLIQDPEQPEPIDDLLSPYVLSSAVELEDRTGGLRLVAFPEREAPRIEAGEGYEPSCLGPGADVVVPLGELRSGDPAMEGLVEASPEALEAWRIARGAARFPVDLVPESLPQEAGLDHTIEYEKGCFLGQEAVARVRNLGHPPFVVLAVRAEGPVRGGEPVVADGDDPSREVGRVTSAASLDGHTAVIARVRWNAREQRLTTGSGVALSAGQLASGTGRP